MKIILANGRELTPLSIYGCDSFVRSVKRDTLYFVFPEREGLGEIDGLFTAKNCSKIIIEEDNGAVFVHEGYTVRAELTKKGIRVGISDNGEFLHEDRIVVGMAQTTYEEEKVAELEEALELILSGETGEE